ETLPDIPQVVSVTPINDSNCDSFSVITGTFSKDMDASTITDQTFLINDGSGNISGNIIYENSTNTAIFTPSRNLESDTTFTATITVAAKDQEGYAIPEDYTWSFKAVLSSILKLGDYHSCIKPNSGDIRCWGWNNKGQLGQGGTAEIGDDPDEMGINLPSIDLGTGRTVKQIAIGQYFNCALLDNGAVKCWGYNTDGQLGLGDMESRGDDSDEMGDNLPAVDLGTGRTAVYISAGTKHTCAILDNEKVKCWGYNKYGGLGQDSTGDIGDEIDEMGDNNPYVNLGTDRTAKSIDAGRYHTCVILDDDSVKCWGGGSKGQLGLGDTEDRGDGIDASGDSIDEMGDNLPVVNLGQNRTPVEIAVGNYHTCARLDNSTVKCWGYNSNGQLGLGDDNERGINPSEMGDNLPPLDLGSGRTVREVSAGASHTCARLDNGHVKCWGSDNGARLGRDVSDDIGDDPGEMGNDLPPVDLGTDRTAVEIAAGSAHNCVRLDNDTIKCWGTNTKGQLGLGDTDNRGDEANEMGDNLPAVDIDTD
ncbi:MAG: hypothetical protein GY867_08605, partial [bacterium]|nr:hypothetical protein [bacterium]